jgi:hypothetical protein
MWRCATGRRVNGWLNVLEPRRATQAGGQTPQAGSAIAVPATLSRSEGYIFGLCISTSIVLKLKLVTQLYDASKCCSCANAEMREKVTHSLFTVTERRTL